MKKSSLLSNLHSDLRNSRVASKSCLHSNNLRNLRNLREIIYILAICGSLILTSCSHTRYIPLPSSHNRDSLSKSVNVLVNTTYVDRTHTLVQRGDTIFKTDSIYVEKFTDIEVHDTIRVTQTDSIPYPVEVPKYIRQRNLYDRITAAGFWVGIGIMIIGILLFLYSRFFLRRPNYFSIFSTFMWNFSRPERCEP